MSNPQNLTKVMYTVENKTLKFTIIKQIKMKKNIQILDLDVEIEGGR